MPLRRTPFLSGSACAAALVLAGLVVSTPAAALTYNPTCQVSSLRAVLNDAASHPDPHTVNLPAGCVYTFTDLDTPANANALPYITFGLTIEGNGAVFARDPAAPPMRFLEIHTPGNVVIRNLTLRGGSQPPSHIVYIMPDNNYDTESAGGAVLCSTTSLTLETVRFENNEAMNGGAVFSQDCPTTVRDSVFSNNRAEGGDGAAVVILHDPTQGGGDTQLHVFDSSFLDNDAGSRGGAIFSMAWLVDVHDSALRRNHAGGSGGAIATRGGTRGGPIFPDPLHSDLFIERSTISRNSAGDRGGGIDTAYDIEGEAESIVTIEYSSVWNNDAAFGGGLSLGNGATITLTTLSGNDAGSSGGAIFQFQRGSLAATRVTIANNVSASGMAHAIFGYGELDLYNVLVAYTDAVPAGTLCTTSSGSGGTVVASDGSMVDGGICYAFTQVPAGKVGLQDLARNGGPTRSHAISIVGDAKDAGDPRFCQPDTGNGTPSTSDQRLDPYVAIDGPNCDVGSYEHQFVLQPQ